MQYTGGRLVFAPPLPSSLLRLPRMHVILTNIYTYCQNTRNIYTYCQNLPISKPRPCALNADAQRRFVFTDAGAGHAHPEARAVRRRRHNDHRRLRLRQRHGAGPSGLFGTHSGHPMRATLSHKLALGQCWCRQCWCQLYCSLALARAL